MAPHVQRHRRNPTGPQRTARVLSGLNRRLHGMHRDESGSLILVILFTIIMSSLILAATATALSGQNKTRNTRDFSQAQQASDMAFANALMFANLGGFTSSPVSNSGTNGATTWTWTATRQSDPSIWEIDVLAEGKNVDRRYSAVLNSNRVVMGRKSTSTGAIDYISETSEYFTYGFFGDTTVDISGAPDIDGYNGVPGMVSTNNSLVLHNAAVDAYLLHDTSTRGTTGRCTGSACTTAARSFKPKSFRTADIPASRCASDFGNWKSSTGSALVQGRCYKSLTFDSNYEINLSGPIYAINYVDVKGDVKVNTGVNSTTPDARRLRIEVVNGGMTIAPGAQFAGAVFAKNGTCKITGATDTLYTTKWLGAAMCGRFEIRNNPRLRYDGGLRALKATSSAGRDVFYLSDYQNID